MSRAERLLALMQCLRRHRHPVTGMALANELQISVRTLYRDIASLRAQGARIDGDPGLGYVLKPGFLLPPLMLSPGELEAIMLGVRWVAQQTDLELASDAGNALAKIIAVLPADLQRMSESESLLVPPGTQLLVDLPLVRRAIRAEHRLSIRYVDGQARHSRRVIWPFALGFFEKVRVVAAWCELRGELRHFRVDRMADVQMLPDRYPKRRYLLLRDWRMWRGLDAS